MKNPLHFLILLGTITIVSSCSKSNEPEPSGVSNQTGEDTVETTAIDLTNQTYGADELQVFDLHLPAKRSYNKTRVAILLHGGAWGKLDKSFMHAFVSEIKSKGDNWVIVNANYRLIYQDSITYEKQIEDISLLIKKIISIRKAYNFSDKIYLIGSSAGGHLALSYAFSIDKSKYIRGVAAITPPSDLTSEKIRKGELGVAIEKLIGASYEDAPDLYRNASPRFFISKVSPPVILFYGGKDELIPADQGELMMQRLKANAVVCSYNFYPEENHEWTPLSETIQKTLEFFGDRK